MEENTIIQSTSRNIMTSNNFNRIITGIKKNFDKSLAHIKISSTKNTVKKGIPV